MDIAPTKEINENQNDSSHSPESDSSASTENKINVQQQLHPQQQSLKDRIMASIMNVTDDEEDGHGDKGFIILFHSKLIF